MTSFVTCSGNLQVWPVGNLDTTIASGFRGWHVPRVVKHPFQRPQLGLPSLVKIEVVCPTPRFGQPTLAIVETPLCNFVSHLQHSMVL
jgi:hypothetical protein